MNRRPVAIVLALVLCSCSTSATSDLLSVGEDSGTSCTPSDSYGVATFSLDELTNHSGSRAAVVSIASPNPRLRVVAWNLRRPDQQSAAVGPGNRLLPGSATTVPPRASMLLNVVIRNSDPTNGQKAENLIVSYKDAQSGAHGKVRTRYAVQVPPAGKICF